MTADGMRIAMDLIFMGIMADNRILEIFTKEKPRGRGADAPLLFSIMSIPGNRPPAFRPQWCLRWRFLEKIAEKSINKKKGDMIEMENQFQIQGACLTILLPQELDHPVADRIRQETDRILGRCYIRTIIFDFRNTAFMDSSGIGMIMGRYKALGMRGNCIRAVHVNDYVGKILYLSGLHRVMEINGQEDAGKEKGEDYGKHQ